MTLSHRGEKDIYDLSCMTDVKKIDVWVRKILLMTSLEQLETTCQIDSNSFCCRTAQGNGSSALKNTEGRKIGLTTSNKSLYHQESKIYQVKVLIFIIFRVQCAGAHAKLYQSSVLDDDILLFSDSHALHLCFKFPSE